MGRRYFVYFENVAIAAASDLVAVNGATGKMLGIIRWGWAASDNTLATAQMITTRARILPATVSAGTGGAAATVQKLDPGDAAATFTARTNDTVKTTTSGTAIVVDENARHVYNGYEQQPEHPIPIGPTSAFVLECINASLQGTVKLSAFVEVEEIG